MNSFNRKPFNYIRNYLCYKTISYTLQYLNISNNYFSFQCTCLKICYYFIISLSSTSKHLTKKSIFRFCQSQVNLYFFIGLEITFARFEQISFDPSITVSIKAILPRFLKTTICLYKLNFYFFVFILFRYI